MPKTEAIAEQNAAEVPLYTFLDVARYLHVPAWAALALLGRGRLHPEETFDYLLRAPVLFPRLSDDYGFPFREDGQQRISFRALTSLFVRSFLFRISPSQGRLPHGGSEEGRRFFESVWVAVQRPASEPSPFADPDVDDVVSHFERYATKIAGLSRDELRKLIALHLDRVELKDRVPVRLYPFSRDPAPDVPRFVVIDPEIRFGRPTVKGAPTDVLAERWRAGDSPRYLAEDYDLTTDEVDEALRYESTPDPLLFPFPCFGW